MSAVTTRAHLRLDTLTLPAAAAPEENPLPPFRALHTASGGGVAYDDSVPAECRTTYAFRGYDSTLPYVQQDLYDRDRQPRALRTAVLENAWLRAEFLLDFGGRLWSLVHQPSGRNLLYTNPVFQPANLAIRNAWFSGGVEWNCGLLGHTPFTCSPLFAARIASPWGGDGLRMWEWERISGVPFQMDFHLAPDRAVLLVRVTLRNPSADEVPMYWWSNLALPETAETRVLVPAPGALRHAYDGKIRLSPLPLDGDIDLSRPQSFLRGAADAYFQVEDRTLPWSATVEGDGKGLFHASTPRLFGRKLFVWGMNPGGRRWQEFLAGGHDAPYIEVQGGLCRTQAEYTPMPGRATWEWLEAYGLVEGDPAKVQGDDWAAAVAEAQRSIEAQTPAAWLAETFEATRPCSEAAPAELLQLGSGWGALENVRRAADGEPPLAGESLPFPDDSLGDAQAPWWCLLEHGWVPEPDPAEAPQGFMVADPWRARLEASLAGPDAGNWLAWLHLGLMRAHQRDGAAAQAAWEQSLELRPSAWAHRNLAVLAFQRGDRETAKRQWEAAAKLSGSLYALTLEAMRALLEAGDAEAATELLGRVPRDQWDRPRLKAWRAKLAVMQGDWQAALALLENLDLPDVREGETLPSQLWFEAQAQRRAAETGAELDDALRKQVREELAPPRHLDFRMH